MLCNMYGDAEGDLILVPECMLAPQSAMRAYGPLRDCGTIRTRVLPGELQEAVKRDFVTQFFSVIAAETAQQLGLDPDGNCRPVVAR